MRELYSSFARHFSHLPVLNTHTFLFHWKQGQNFALPIVEFLGAPVLAEYNHGLTQRAAASRDSRQEESFGRCRREAAAGSAGWQESRTPGCAEEEDLKD